MLTKKDLAEIKRLREEDTKRWTYKALGEKFGVTKQWISILLNPKARANQYAIMKRFRSKYDQAKANPSSSISTSSGQL